MNDEKMTQELPAIERPIYVKCGDAFKRSSMQQFKGCGARLDDVGSEHGELCLDCEKEISDAYADI